MLSINQKQILINHLYLIKLWVNNYGAIRYYEICNDSKGWLSEHDFDIDEKTESAIEKFLHGICDIENSYDPCITKIYI